MLIQGSTPKLDGSRPAASRAKIFTPRLVLDLTPAYAHTTL